ncbi:hypothetical protein PVAND_002970 [Polypedilum vanderplanki]|uniref:Essential MCU regulator, mitochondrial n=1 Tax=Polypedilum vanderplanki TaxID=319348 RepID=A0A9J6BT21_POLVA|nr:hypothetical protein PVAND_002970 [Polypedilum vanderplanki]
MIPKLVRLLRTRQLIQQNRQMGVYYRSGALKPQPVSNAVAGFIGVVGVVIPGILLGAFISKNIASFLEENDLFVPEDEDDD